MTEFDASRGYHTNCAQDASLAAQRAVDHVWEGPMRNDGGRIILSPLDLMRFQACEHASALDLRDAKGEDLIPGEGAADAALRQKKGHEHR
jgi:hypothetical protein